MNDSSPPPTIKPFLNQITTRSRGISKSGKIEARCFFIDITSKVYYSLLVTNNRINKL